MTSPDAARGPDHTANRLALLARWADDLAHEIKNPFHAMVINLELVKRRAGDPEALEERAEVVESELHRVHSLVDSVLALVRPWPETDSARVGPVFDALFPVFRARMALHHIDYHHEADDGPAAVSMRPADLALVLLNLVDNALEAAPVGGTVRTVCEYGDTVVIRVTDDGPGFPTLDGDPFDAGVSTRAGRPGLGLAVSRELAWHAGGSLVAEPTGGGTALVLTLPRSGD